MPGVVNQSVRCEETYRFVGLAIAGRGTLLASADHNAWSPGEGIRDLRRAQTISNARSETFHFAMSPFMTSTKRDPSFHRNPGGP